MNVRDPKDVIVGRIEGRINQEIADQKLKARQVAEAKVRSAAKAGQARIQGQPAPAGSAGVGAMPATWISPASRPGVRPALAAAQRHA